MKKEEKENRREKRRIPKKENTISTGCEMTPTARAVTGGQKQKSPGDVPPSTADQKRHRLVLRCEFEWKNYEMLAVF